MCPKAELRATPPPTPHPTTCSGPHTGAQGIKDDSLVLVWAGAARWAGGQ